MTSEPNSWNIICVCAIGILIEWANNVLNEKNRFVKKPVVVVQVDGIFAWDGDN